MLNLRNTITFKTALSRTFLVFFSLLALTSPVFAGSDNTIIAFGDSITVGKGVYNDSPGDGVSEGGYEPFLKEYLVAAGLTFEVRNYGVSGESIIGVNNEEGGDIRIEEVLEDNDTAKYILILEGTNDLYHGVNKPENVIAALESMVKLCKNTYQITPVLSTLPPDMTEGKGEDKDIEEFNSLITTMAEKNDVMLIDPYTAMVDDWISTYALGTTNSQGVVDYLHLNEVGYKKLAEIWYKAILQIEGVPEPEPEPEPEPVPVLSPWMLLLLNESSE